ncbi:hypothetical protein SLA2020_168710 [Shorea laevis]
MRIRTGFFCILLSLLFAANVCHAGEDQTKVEVFGASECAGCEENNVPTSHAFKGLKVAIDCKPENGEFKTRGSGELDGEGNFKVSLPVDRLKDGKLKEECYARLHSAAADPCPAHDDGLESSKVVLKSESDGKQSFGLKGKLKFSPVTCASAFLFPKFKPPILPVFPPVYKKPLPPFYKKPFYKKPLPPIPVYKKPLLPPIPIYKKPLLPPIPIYKKPLPPPIPIYKKPLPPPIPIYKKPLPPPIPIYKKPLPPPIPIYKKPLPPPIPIYKKPLPPPIPIYKKPLPPPIPIYKKPLPPPIPIYKKPLPPLVPIYKPKPPFPPFPPKPKFFHHPKFGKFPPLSSTTPQP